MSKIRKSLSEINEKHRDNQQCAMKDLGKKYEHSCELVELGPDNFEEDYPAFVHCFDLQKFPQIMKNKELFFCGPGYRYPDKFKWESGWRSFYGVAHHFLEQINSDEIQDGDIVFYLAERTENIKEMVVIHAGKIANGKVISKWGRGKKDSSTNISKNFSEFTFRNVRQIVILVFRLHRDKKKLERISILV